jgi:hypothetical protein
MRVYADADVPPHVGSISSSQGDRYPSGTTTLWLADIQSGTIEIDLVNTDPGPAVVGLGFGVLSGGSCTRQVYVEALPSGSPQIASKIQGGTYCIDVSDLGSVGLSGVTFSIQVSLR